MKSTFSVVIPAYNEEKYLPRLLDSLEAAGETYRRAGGQVEVIVADNASTDCTAEVAAARGCRVVGAELRAIAAARNAGGRAARGDTLAFVDADTVRVHPDTFGALDSMLGSGRFVAVATGVDMERWSAGLALSYALMLPMVWLTGMDTGMVCCRRADFEAVGGYDEGRLIAEDVTFLLSLRRLGKRRGQRLGRARTVKAVASTRKFDQHGDWHYFTQLPRLAVRMALGKPAAREFIRRYWYEPPR